MESKKSEITVALLQLLEMVLTPEILFSIGGSIGLVAVSTGIAFVLFKWGATFGCSV